MALHMASNSKEREHVLLVITHLSSKLLSHMWKAPKILLRESGTASIPVFPHIKKNKKTPTQPLGFLMLKKPFRASRGTSPAAPSGILAAAPVPHNPPQSRRAAPCALYPAPQPAIPAGNGSLRLFPLSAPSRGRGTPGAAPGTAGAHRGQVPMERYVPTGDRCPGEFRHPRQGVCPR